MKKNKRIAWFSSEIKILVFQIQTKFFQNVTLRKDERLGGVPYIVYIDRRLHQTENCSTSQTNRKSISPPCPPPPHPPPPERCGKIQIHSTQILKRNTREEEVRIFKTGF